MPVTLFQTTRRSVSVELNHPFITFFTRINCRSLLRGWRIISRPHTLLLQKPEFVRVVMSSSYCHLFMKSSKSRRFLFLRKYPDNLAVTMLLLLLPWVFTAEVFQSLFHFTCLLRNHFTFDNFFNISYEILISLHVSKLPLCFSVSKSFMSFLMLFLLLQWA